MQQEEQPVHPKVSTSPLTLTEHANRRAVIWTIATVALSIIVGVGLLAMSSASKEIAQEKRALYCIGILMYAQSAAYQGLAGSYNQRELLDTASKAGQTLPRSNKSVEERLRDQKPGRKYVPQGLTLNDMNQIDERIRRWAALSGDQGGGGWAGGRLTGQAMDELDSCFLEFR